MSTSPTKNAPRPAYVEEADDSQDEVSEEPTIRPAANVARKVTRRDGASDSGYSSRTHTTGSSSQSSKKQAPAKASLLGKTMGLMGKKSSSSTKKSATKEAVAAPAKTARRHSTSKQKANVEVRRPSIHETRDDAARMDISGKPVKSKHSAPAEAYARPIRPTTQPSSQHIPVHQSFTLPRPQARPLPYITSRPERPHSYHMEAIPPMYGYAHSLPTQPTQHIQYAPRQYIHPLSIPPMQQQQQQPMQVAPPAPLPPPPPPPPQLAQQQQAQSGFYVVPSGPTSPNRLINYNFSHTQPPQSYFQPQPPQHGYWQHGQPYREPPSRRMSASFVPQQRTIVEYPSVPAPSQPPTPLSYHSNYGPQIGETMTRTSSLGAPRYLPPRPQPEETFFMEEEDDYWGMVEREAADRNAIEREAARRAESARVSAMAMPPPPRPMYPRANTTSMVHPSNPRRVNRRSIEQPIPSPRKHSMESHRPPLSSGTSYSSGASSRNVPYMEAPPSPPLRRRSQVVSFLGTDRLANEIEAYQQNTNGASANVGLDDVLTHKALKQKVSKAKTSRSGPSDTTSRTSSKSGDKKSKRVSKDGHRDRHDDDSLTVRMKGMKLDINGHQGSVNIRQGDNDNLDISLGGQAKPQRAIKDRESRSVKYLPTGSGKGDVEVNRSSRTRSRSTAAHEGSRPPAANGAVRRLKEGSRSRRNSTSRGPAAPSPVEASYPPF